MATLDIFNSDAFSMVSLTQAVNKIPYKPSLLRSSGLFTPRPITTISFGVEKKDGVLSLIQTSERGAPPVRQGNIDRDIRDFRTVRLFKQDKLYAHEIQGVRAFGSETEVQTMMTEVSDRMGRLLDDLQLTLEYHMLATVGGILLDANGSTLRNYFTEWGISQPSDITFSDAAVTTAGDMRVFLAKNIVRPMLRAAKVPEGAGLMPMALVGDNFWDWLTRHPDVVKTYLNWAAAVELREGNAFGGFRFGGVEWVNYRGTDDDSTVTVGANKARFFLKGVPDLFQTALSPAESFEFVNTRGQEYYARTVVDTARQEWVEIEVMSYPLTYCSRPDTLLRGTI